MKTKEEEKCLLMEYQRIIKGLCQNNKQFSEQDA